MNRLLAMFCALAAFACASPAWAVPRIDHPVNDYAHVLSDADVTRISDRIVATRNATGVQMALLVVDTTDGEPIDDFALAAARQWGGGTATRNDGILVTFAIRDHHSDIETGTGVQDRVTDAVARRILDDARPALRSGRYGDALADTMTATGEAVGARFGGGVATQHVQKHGMSDDEIILLIVAMIVLALLLAWFFSRSNRGYSSGSSSFFFFDSGSSSGSSSSSSDSDWGGGGGGFDGGGSSGDW